MTAPENVSRRTFTCLPEEVVEGIPYFLSPDDRFWKFGFISKTCLEQLSMTMRQSYHLIDLNTTSTMDFETKVKWILKNDFISQAVEQLGLIFHKGLVKNTGQNHLQFVAERLEQVFQKCSKMRTILFHKFALYRQGQNECIWLTLVANNCKQLKELKLDDCYFGSIPSDTRYALDYAGIQRVSKSCPKLEYFGISHHNINAIELTKTVENLVCLRVLLIVSVARIEDSELQRIISKCQFLKRLYLKQCVSNGGKMLAFIASICSELEHIFMTSQKHITDEEVLKLINGCQSMKEIYLSKCKFITDVTFRNIGEKCLQLERLCLQGCREISESAVNFLVNRCTSLVKLCLYGCQMFYFHLNRSHFNDHYSY